MLAFAKSLFSKAPSPERSVVEQAWVAYLEVARDEEKSVPAFSEFARIAKENPTLPVDVFSCFQNPVFQYWFRKSYEMAEPCAIAGWDRLMRRITDAEAALEGGAKDGAMQMQTWDWLSSRQTEFAKAIQYHPMYLEDSEELFCSYVRDHSDVVFVPANIANIKEEPTWLFSLLSLPAEVIAARIQWLKRVLTSGAWSAVCYLSNHRGQTILDVAFSLAVSKQFDAESCQRLAILLAEDVEFNIETAKLFFRTLKMLPEKTFCRVADMVNQNPRLFFLKELVLSVGFRSASRLPLIQGQLDNYVSRLNRVKEVWQIRLDEEKEFKNLLIDGEPFLAMSRVLKWLPAKINAIAEFALLALTRCADSSQWGPEDDILKAVEELFSKNPVIEWTRLIRERGFDLGDELLRSVFRLALLAGDRQAERVWVDSSIVCSFEVHPILELKDQTMFSSALNKVDVRILASPLILKMPEGSPSHGHNDLSFSNIVDCLLQYRKVVSQKIFYPLSKLEVVYATGHLSGLFFERYDDKTFLEYVVAQAIQLGHFSDITAWALITFPAIIPDLCISFSSVQALEAGCSNVARVLAWRALWLRLPNETDRRRLLNLGGDSISLCYDTLQEMISNKLVDSRNEEILVYLLVIFLPSWMYNREERREILQEQSDLVFSLLLRPVFPRLQCSLTDLEYHPVLLASASLLHVLLLNKGDLRCREIFDDCWDALPPTALPSLLSWRNDARSIADCLKVAKVSASDPWVLNTLNRFSFMGIYPKFEKDVKAILCSSRAYCFIRALKSKDPTALSVLDSFLSPHMEGTWGALYTAIFDSWSNSASKVVAALLNATTETPVEAAERLFCVAEGGPSRVCSRDFWRLKIADVVLEPTVFLAGPDVTKLISFFTENNRDGGGRCALAAQRLLRVEADLVLAGAGDGNVHARVRFR